MRSKIYVAGHRGMVGSAIVRALQAMDCHAAGALCNDVSDVSARCSGVIASEARQSMTSATIITRTHTELDLTNQAAVQAFFATEKPTQVYLAAAKVGGIHANNTYPADFIYQNLMMQANVIDAAFQNGVQKLLFLGSSCIYPRDVPQPMREDALLTGPLEPTNEPYAIAKIAGIKLCESYNRQYGASHGVDYRSVMPTNELSMTFDDRQKREFSMLPYLQYPAFAALNDVDPFRRARVAHGPVIWTDEIDISPDTLYIDGKPD